MKAVRTWILECTPRKVLLFFGNSNLKVLNSTLLSSNSLEIFLTFFIKSEGIYTFL